MFLRVFFLILAASFLADGALAEEGWLELEDPREFLGACSFETATPITFEEAALNYQDHLGECIQITGYYSTAFYDGVEGFYQVDGDGWFGVPAEILKRYKLGLYYSVDHDPRFAYQSGVSREDPERIAYWSQTFGTNNFKRRNVTLAASLYSCEQWLSDAGKTNQDMDFVFHDYCRYETGAIVVVHDWKLVPGQDYDPVLDIWNDIINEDGEVQGPHTIGWEGTKCKWEDSEVVDFKEIALKPYLYREKCLRFSGLYGGMVIYDGLDLFNNNQGLYLAMRDDSESINSNRIGIFNHWNFEEILNWEGGKRAEVEMVGWVINCDQYSDSSRLGRVRVQEIAEKLNPDPTVEVVFVGGYCNFWGTHFVVDEVRKISKPFERFTGPENREKYGNLTSVTEDWKHLESSTKAVHKLLGENLDRAPRPGQKTEDLPLKRYFAALNKAGESGLELAFLLEEAWPDYPERVDAHGCFCLEENCQGLWPISTVDTRYRHDLPYMCFKLNIEDEDDNAYGYAEW